MIKIINTEYLTEEARSIREKVFIDEQGFEKEFDSVDESANCVVLYENDIPMACCRYYSGQEAGEYIVGRLAVLKKYRGRRLGEQLLEKVEDIIRMEGGTKVSLSAQIQAKRFYEKQGYKIHGNIYYDEHCEHVHMEKIL